METHNTATTTKGRTAPRKGGKPAPGHGRATTTPDGAETAPVGAVAAPVPALPPIGDPAILPDGQGPANDELLPAFCRVENRVPLTDAQKARLAEVQAANCVTENLGNSLRLPKSIDAAGLALLAELDAGKRTRTATRINDLRASKGLPPVTVGATSPATKNMDPITRAMIDTALALRTANSRTSPATTQPGKTPTTSEKEPTMKNPTRSTKSTTASKARTPVKAAAKTDGVRPGTKLEIVANLLKRKNGCTAAEVLKATGWTAVSMPQQAKAAGLKLTKKKEDGGVTRYCAA